ncbi:MAG: hypothetical protein ACYCYK_06250 [Candidatus Dormibacteria bacterium]
MADHRRRLHQQRERRDRVRRQGRGCHFPIWAVLPELEEERVRRLDQELEQVAELEDQP